ncbi:flagellar hook-associated protein 2 [Halalkalibacter urbisdiaboli]|uniref:flagellar hook-associated protein 2 n=1 Tax=Halalkalibacter urbisdiaboli TaxID=1960589 RepID=UPI000B45219B|nr:flagellar hook-associated protein 2 [Halalkalibacter urbisdiaboli]
MRIGGIASGLDTESIIKQLMQVERQPLDRMFQRKQTLEWQRDAYREVNTMLTNLERSAYSLRLTAAFNTRSVTNPSSGAFTATANSSVQNGNYEVEVQQVATKTRNISTENISADGKKISTTGTLASQTDAFKVDPSTYDGQSFTITTYNANGDAQSKSFNVDSSKSLDALFKEINGANLGVKAYYDSAYDKVVIERTETGKFTSSADPAAPQIEFGGDTGFLTDVLKLDQASEVGGQNAIVKFRNLSLDPTRSDAPIEKEQRSNTVTFGGITINAQQTTNNTFETFSVSSNTDQAFENIKSFVDKYNETITNLRGKLSEERYRNFPPLTDEQRREMSEREAELWDEKAKSGLLRRDSMVSSVIDKMRLELYTPVETSGQYNQLTEIGITTAKDYRMGGILEIDETKLRAALETDPDSVYQLFNNTADKTLTDIPKENRTLEQNQQISSQTGLVARIRTSLNDSMNNIVRRAGNEHRTNQQFTIGREMVSIDSRINNFQRRLTQIEDRYWSQFTRMEQAMNQANAQGAALMNQLGMGMM